MDPLPRRISYAPFGQEHRGVEDGMPAVRDSAESQPPAGSLFSASSARNMLSWWFRPAVLAVLVAIVALSPHHPAFHGRGLGVLLALLATVLAWVLELLAERRSGRPWLPALILASVAGALLTVADPRTPAVAFLFVAAGICGAVLPLLAAAALAGLSVLVMIVGAVAGGSADSRNLLLFIPLLGLITLAGAMRRSFTQRAEQTELLLAQAERARAAEAHTAALAERARIARELHDVLAHSVAALAMQLEAADALLTGGQVDRAHETVLRARELAKNGLTETRRAVSALREDGIPLPERLQALITAHGPGATLSIQGPPRELAADVDDALYRAVQEGLTNALKHAPGAATTVCLTYEPDTATVTVHNGPARRPALLAGTGAGLGLRGMAERAAALGGSTEQGPTPDGWSVRVRIPA
jgi:signal transduction histidine kinase